MNSVLFHYVTMHFHNFLAVSQSPTLTRNFKKKWELLWNWNIMPFVTKYKMLVTLENPRSPERELACRLEINFSFSHIILKLPSLLWMKLNLLNFYCWTEYNREKRIFREWTCKSYKGQRSIHEEERWTDWNSFSSCTSPQDFISGNYTV